MYAKKKLRSNEPRKQKNRDLNDFIVFAKKKFDNKGLNTEENGIQRVLCYPCYKNKKITEIEYNKDKIFQHIIHKHQDLFEVECLQCGEMMSSKDNDKINDHICTYKENHKLVLHSDSVDERQSVFNDDSLSEITSFGNFFNSYY